MPHIRLLAVDIDGTLLDSHYQIPLANLAALRRAHGAGVEVVLVTGRRHAFAVPIAEMLGFDLWLISLNGAITRSTRGETFHRDFLPVETAHKLLTHMREFRTNTVVTFDGEYRGCLVVERIDDLHASIARWMEKNEKFIECVVPLVDALVSDPIQAMFCGNIERMNAALRHLADGAFYDRITVLKTQYDARDLCIVDVLNRGCSKGHALRRWAEYCGIGREQVMAIGDNFNDVEMLEFAGVPVIMGNACAELKQNGWLVSASNDEGGVAAALEQVGI